MNGSRKVAEGERPGRRPARRIAGRRRRQDSIPWGFLVFLIVMSGLAVLTAGWALDSSLPFMSKAGASRFPFFVIGPTALVCWIIFLTDMASGHGRPSHLRRDGKDNRG